MPQDSFAARYGAVVSIQYAEPARGRPSPDLFAHACAGTLVAPTLVLTAAHCVSQDMPTRTGTGYSVLAGERVLSRRGAGSRSEVAVESIFVHPKFRGRADSRYTYYGFDQPNDQRYDLAVLRLAAPITQVAPMQVVQAAEDAAVWGAGAGRTSGAEALGWGYQRSPYEPGAPRDGALRIARVPIRADRACERSDEGLGLGARAFDRTSMLCAGTVDAPRTGNSAIGTCMGDDGGPLLATAPDGSLRLVGVATGTVQLQRCTTWSIFARVPALRDWIASVPPSGAAPGGLLPPTATAGMRDGADLRITWTPSTSPSVVRYRVYRTPEQSRPPFRFMLGGTADRLVLAGIADAGAASLTLEGVEPARPGARADRLVRVDAEDADGNRIAGELVRVPAPIDARRPTTPGTPNVRPQRRGTFVTFSRSTDADCVRRYVVEVRRERGWRPVAEWSNESCDAALTADAATFRPWGAAVSGTESPRVVKVVLRGLSAGTWRFRVVARDRAGNSAVSASRAVTLSKATRGGGGSMCSSSSLGWFCSRSPVRGLLTATTTGAPVDVIVG